MPRHYLEHVRPRTRKLWDDKLVAKQYYGVERVPGPVH